MLTGAVVLAVVVTTSEGKWWLKRNLQTYSRSMEMTLVKQFKMKPSSSVLNCSEEMNCGSRKIPVFSIWLAILLAAEIVMLLLTPSTSAGYVPPEPKYKCPTLNKIWPCVCVSGDDFGLKLLCEDVSFY